ncbi:MAG: MotA/TolQ/ExbB proton channel family protein [Bacteroidota bacterium]
MNETLNSAAEPIMLWDLFLQGGVTMFFITLIFIWTVFIIFERLLTLSRTYQNTETLTGQVRIALQEGTIQEAIAICEKRKSSPFNRMLHKGLERMKFTKEIKPVKTAIEDIGELELFKLEKNLATLATLAGAAPMLGFLGTVIGMIEVFMDLHNLEGSITPQMLSEGIYQAMVTTAGGLAVGIVAYVAYNVLTARVQKVVYRMKQLTFEFLDTLQSA